MARGFAGRQGRRDHLDAGANVAGRQETRTAAQEPGRRIAPLPRLRRQTPHDTDRANGTNNHETTTTRKRRWPPACRPPAPDYVVVTWVSEQLRDRAQRNGASLAEALQTGKKQDREPVQSELEDREAE